MMVKLFSSSSHNPYFNLALEEFLMQEETNVPSLYLWQNDKSVIMGAYQNPYKECHLANIEKDGVYLVRRYTGGGAVYQDLGNAIFSFWGPENVLDKNIVFQLVLDTLKKLNIYAQVSGRNDIIVSYDNSDRKISGSAFSLKKGLFLHHGTMLINLNTSQLKYYLTPDKEKFLSKGIDSVRSRIINLIDINPHITKEKFFSTLTESFLTYYRAQGEFVAYDESELKKNEILQSKMNKLSDDNWIYGNTPGFSHRIEKRFLFGYFEFYFEMDQLKISHCKLYSDSIYIDWLQFIETNIIKYHYIKKDLIQFLDELILVFPHLKTESQELIAWFINELYQ